MNEHYEKPAPETPMSRFERSYATVTKRLRLETNRGTIRNARKAFGRNRKVAIAGVVGKFKTFAANRLPIPITAN